MIFSRGCSISGIRHYTRILFKLLSIFTVAVTGLSAQPWSVVSPDSNLVIEVKQDIVASVAANQKNCYFRVLLDEAAVLDWSPMGVTTNDQNYVSDLTFVKKSENTVDETYTLPSGKRSVYHNHCNELVLTFSNSNNRQVAFYIRAYDDAAAFCSELLGSGSAQVTGEASGFSLPSGSTGWGHIMPNDERSYDQFNVGANAVSLGIPILFKTASDDWILVTEAAVYGDYTGTGFASKTASKNVFQTAFPSGQGSISGTLPWKLPWRVAIIGNSLGPIVESSVVEHLNPPCELTDTGWIHSGRSTWSWLTQETGDINQQKRYIDFAEEMGWEYNLIDWNYDKSKVQETCQYGAQRGVSNELWYNYSDVKSQAQQSSVFSQCRTWGVKSLKIDFIFDSNNENTSYNHALMQWYDMTAKNLADNKLMVTFHGCTVPRGERRRWPHIMTREGILGYEWIGRGYPGTKHNCTIPFTRNVIGPMDHTPVLITTGQLTNGSGASRASTDAHEIALSVIYESGIQHFADRPEGYNSCIGKEFLKIVPSAWDDTRFIDGYPGQSVVMARRKGNDWYVAGISAVAAKTFEVSLDFLKEGSYSVDLYRDSSGTQRTATRQRITITPSAPLSVAVNNNGGFCCRIPESYEPPVAVMPSARTKQPVNNRNGHSKLSLYRRLRGTSLHHSLQEGDRLIDLRGKSVSVKGSPERLPNGIFIKAGAQTGKK
jgi:alpha-glucosidase